MCTDNINEELCHRLRTSENVSDMTDAAARIEALTEEVLRLRGVVEKLGSSEAFTLPFAMSDNAEAKELRARMEYARTVTAE